MPEGHGLLFPALKASSVPWMSRQSVWHAIARARKVMHKITAHRRWNPDSKFNGSHVHVHGASRHTSAALLLSSAATCKTSDATSSASPCEAVIMEVQQRSDVQTFRRHYWHAQEDQVQSALEQASVPGALQVTITNATDACLGQQHQGKPTLEQETVPGALQVVHATLAQTPASAEYRPIIADTIGPEQPPTPRQHAHTHISRNAWRNAKRRQLAKERSLGNE